MIASRSRLRVRNPKDNRASASGASAGPYVLTDVIVMTFTLGSRARRAASRGGLSQSLCGGRRRPTIGSRESRGVLSHLLWAAMGIEPVQRPSESLGGRESSAILEVFATPPPLVARRARLAGGQVVNEPTLDTDPRA